MENIRKVLNIIIMAIKNLKENIEMEKCLKEKNIMKLVKKYMKVNI